jgi:hypothetical protein
MEFIMADQYSNLSPEEYQQQQQITRQQKMAEMLMSQNQQPQGQMVSGRYVPTSFFQNILPLVNTYVGKGLLEEGDIKQQKLAEELRKREISDIQKYQEMYRGTPEQQIPQAGPPSEAMLKENQVNLPNRIIAGQAANPNAANLFAATSYSAPLRAMGLKKLTEGPKWEKADLPQADGTVLHGWVDYNSPNPKDTFVEGGTKPAMSAYEKAQLERKEFEWNNLSADQKARLKNEAARIGISAQQLFYDTGMSGFGGYNVPNQQVAPIQPVAPIQRQSTNQPNNQPINQPINQQNANYGSPIINKQSTNIPPYAQSSFTVNTNAGNIPVVPNVNLAGVPPKKQAEIIAEQAKTLQTNVKNSYEAYPVIKEIQNLLPSSSSGSLQRGITGAARSIGYSTEKSRADTQLDLLAPKLTMLQPRFEGPQGVLDVKLYESMAGKLADSTLPYEDRLAALEQLKNIYKRYAPNLDWTYSVQPTTLPSSNDSKKNANTQPSPAGVDPAVWAIMSPQERSLWLPQNKR